MDVHPITRGVQDLFVTLEIARARSARTWGRSAVEVSALVFISLRQGVTPNAIANRLSLTTGSVTALLDRLQAAGLIVRLNNPQDRRSLLIDATDEGRTMALDFIAGLDAIVVETVRDLDADAVAMTERVLGLINKAVAANTPITPARAPANRAGAASG